MIIGDDTDIITTFKFGIENATKRISVDTYNDPTYWQFYLLQKLLQWYMVQITLWVKYLMHYRM